MTSKTLSVEVDFPETLAERIEEARNRLGGINYDLVIQRLVEYALDTIAIMENRVPR